MADTALADFAVLLRRLRDGAGISQESLAERAGISVNAISMYERGWPGAPRGATVSLLADALQLEAETRTQFQQAALRRRPAPTTDDLHNLPVQQTSFIGRCREIEDISKLLAQRRIVTVTGAGGIGKTRTALEVASRLAVEPLNGIWFVDLAAANDESSILREIASVLELRLRENGDAAAELVAAMRGRDLLLILDNCEHILSGVRSVVTSILEACPRIALLVTSRERLGIAGERVFLLSPMPLPTAFLNTAAEGRSYDALALFAERAAAANPALALSDEQIESVAEICRRVDGIPLAIELAAARLPLVGLSALRAQLAKNFRLIAGGRHDLPARQRSLDATLSWSHDLLNERDRTLFRRLSVFIGGWTLEAAEAACADDLLAKEAISESLFALAEKSLVIADTDAPAPRYTFFESTRAFAAERLAEAGEAMKFGSTQIRSALGTTPFTHFVVSDGEVHGVNEFS